MGLAISNPNCCERAIRDTPEVSAAAPAVVNENDKLGRTRKMKNTWGRVKQGLLDDIGQNNYSNWIEPLDLTKIENGVAVFSVPTSFMANWVSRNFTDQILAHLKAANAPTSRLEFQVVATQPAAVAVQPTVQEPRYSAPVAHSAPAQSDLPGAPLMPVYV